MDTEQTCPTYPTSADPWLADIRALAAMPEWRALRDGLAGGWRRDPTGNAARLRAFVGDGTDGRRVRVVLAYLAGAAFRSGRLSHPEIDRLFAEVREVAERQAAHLRGRVFA